MANNYLITGYWGEPHITPENDRGINAAIFGPGRFILPVGEQLKSEYIGNNTVRLYDGKLIDNGAVAGIPAGEYVDLLIPEAGQGMNRVDLIVFQYSKDDSTLIESGQFVVLQGIETSETASEPDLTQQDLLTNEAILDQMALYSVSVSGAEISAPKRVAELINPVADYIVEQGSINSLTYRKWNSGVIELWGRMTATYYNANMLAVSVSLTANGIKDIANVNLSGCNKEIYNYTYNYLVNTNADVLILQCTDNKNSFSSTTQAEMSVEIKGTWK